MPIPTTCRGPACPNPVHALGLCTAHQQQRERHPRRPLRPLAPYSRDSAELRVRVDSALLVRLEAATARTGHSLRQVVSEGLARGLP